MKVTKSKRILGALLFSSLFLAACSADEGNTKKQEAIEVAIESDQLEQYFTDPTVLEFTKSVINTKFKDFKLPAVYGGETIDTSKFKGKPFIVKYAYSGCSACQQTQPHIQKFMEENPDVPIIQVFNETDTKESIDNFLTTTGTFEHDLMVIDNQDVKFAETHKAKYTPSLYFIDHNGNISFATIGSVDETRLDAYMDLAFNHVPKELYTPRSKANIIAEVENKK
ncbi:hypothetical protein ABD91_20170 [Lysinibacillus sphaericus]|uniref:TlpA family protein disulfide reductase n=1 Tax=Lysinibacillus sphaericus TaxID=1421 RepID=UPI0018CE6816|nr:TlpA disulfide reductase family protein [Lysinibacillus sphaericus]MBG9693075.1 hypothetical protein [Lysinibacillus sphaericus]